MDIEPINTHQQKQVIEQTYDYIHQATVAYHQTFKRIDVLFDLSGRNAGMYRVNGRQHWIRYNPYIFSRYFDDSLQSTVPHEVAHYITDCLYGLKKIRPHGIEWQGLMHTFNAKPEVTGNYDLTGIPQRRQKRYNYHCACMQHQISAVRHYRILNQQMQYYCKHCNQSIRATSS